MPHGRAPRPHVERESRTEHPISPTGHGRPLPQYVDSRLANGVELYGQPGPAIPSPEERQQGHVTYGGHDGRSHLQGSTNNNTPPPYIEIHPAMNADTRAETHTIRSSFGQEPIHPDENTQAHNSGPGAAEQYLPPNPGMSAPGHTVDMTLYPSGPHMNTAGRQPNPSIVPPYTHAPAESLPAPLHHFAVTAHPSGHASQGQGLEGGYNDYQFSAVRSPHFGYGASPQYPMPGSASIDTSGFRTNLPPEFGHQRPSQSLPVSDPTHPQQVQIRDPTGESHAHHRPERWNKRPSQSCLTERPSAQSSPGSDTSSGPVSRNHKKPRAPFSEEARRETGATRKTGACIRCRIQRSRVSADLFACSLPPEVVG